MWAFPWPWMPQTPTRMTSLAPRTRPDDFVPAMVTAAAAWRKSRRVTWVMGEVLLGNSRNTIVVRGLAGVLPDRLGHLSYGTVGFISCIAHTGFSLHEVGLQCNETNPPDRTR